MPLAGVGSPDLVLFTVGHALGVRDEAAGSLLAAVLRRIDQHKLLLVLDNFEHVAVAALLRRCFVAEQGAPFCGQSPDPVDTCSQSALTGATCVDCEGEPMCSLPCADPLQGIPFQRPTTDVFHTVCSG